MNYHDFLQRIEAIQALLGGIDISADAQHVGIAYRIHALLDSMKDECRSCIRQETMAARDTTQSAE